MAGETHDVVVVGGGPAGEVCAARLSDRALHVALVERELVGGECSYWACMPSKALLRPHDALEEAEHVAGVAQAVHGALDVAAVFARRDEVIHDLDDSAQVPWLDDHGVELVRGHARLAGERVVEVEGRTLRARTAVVVATGSSAAVPPIDGLAEARPWTNREVTTAHAAPGRLLILGGGVVAVEMAQAYASLGSEVTIVERHHRLIAQEEDFAADDVEAGLARAGVTIRCGAGASAVRRGPEGVEMTLDDGATLTGDELLVATGRRPRTEDLGLETLGLEAGKPIEVDEQLRVAGQPWLYAIGDVNGRQLLTHMGKYQGRLVADGLTGGDGTMRAQTDPPPRVIFTDPQVAAVGHTLASAREAGLDVRAVDVPTQSTAGASFFGHGRDDGTARLVLRDDVVVGATLTGPDVAEMLHVATIAVASSLPLSELRHAVAAFPTRSEVWLNLLTEAGA